ncbi:hypothetical protein D3C81_504270 [compost metagenome]
MLGIGRHPYGVVRRRQEALAGYVQVHHAVGGVVELAPGMAMGCAVGVGTEFVVAKVDRGRELVERGDSEEFARHACLVRRAGCLDRSIGFQTDNR